MAGQLKPNPNYVTSFDSYSFQYEWKISNADGRLSKKERLRCPEAIKSPSGALPATTWWLEAFQPTQEGTAAGFTVEMILVSGGPVWASVRIATLVKRNPYGIDKGYCYNDLNVSPYSRRPVTVFRLNRESFKAFIPLGEIQKYFDDTDFNIYCSIFINKLDNPKHVKNVPVTAIELNVRQFDLSKLIEDARHKGRYTDVTIVSADMEFKAHKVVLASQSAFFETGLEERWKKDGAHRVEMLDVPADTMDTILTYMYTGKVENIDKSALDLLPKAEEYQLEGLKIMCEEALSKTLTAETVIDVLVMADTHNAQNLKQSCLTFITKNITDVKKSSAWREEKLRSEANKDLWMEVSDFIINSL